MYIQASRLLKNYSCWILTLEKSGPRPRGRVETRAARLGPPLSLMVKQIGVTFSRTFLTPDTRTSDVIVMYVNTLSMEFVVVSGNLKSYTAPRPAFSPGAIGIAY